MRIIMHMPAQPQRKQPFDRNHQASFGGDVEHLEADRRRSALTVRVYLNQGRRLGRDPL
jgi:hypothetical protein